MVWQWLLDGKGLLMGALGGVVLFFYGVILTLQLEPAFGRVYAAYGGVFVVLPILWSWYLDGWRPDRYDSLGASIALIGVFVIMWGRTGFDRRLPLWSNKM